MFGEERRRAAEVSRSVLPWACLTPDIAVRRLLRDWALHRRQVRASQIDCPSSNADLSVAQACRDERFHAEHSLICISFNSGNITANFTNLSQFPVSTVSGYTEDAMSS